MTENNNRYAIAYHSLSIGKHLFEFECDGDFLNSMSGGIYTKGNCSVKATIDKGASLATIKCEIAGKVEVECDRCLDPFMADIYYKGSVFVKFSHEIENPTFENDSDGESDILWMNPADNYIDLGQYIYESIILALPARRIHPLDENGVSLCNPDMLARFSIAPDGFDDDNYDQDYDESYEYDQDIDDLLEEDDM